MAGFEDALKGSVFGNGQAMQLAGLAVMQGEDVGSAINKGLVQSAQMQQQAMVTQEYEQQKKMQQMLPQLMQSIDLTKPEESFAKLVQSGMKPQDAANIIKMKVDTQQESRLQKQQDMWSGGGTGTGGIDLRSMSDDDLIKMSYNKAFETPIKLEMDRRRDEGKISREKTTKDEDRVLPATVLTDLSENQGLLTKITDAENEVAKNGEAFGVGGYIAQNQGLNIFSDPKNVSSRAVVGDLGSSVIKDRSGAAVSLAEFPRLAPFIPQIGDKAPVIAAKLKKLRKGIEEENTATLKVYKDAGYNTRDLGSTTPTAAAAPSIDETDPRVAEARKAGWADDEISEAIKAADKGKPKTAAPKPVVLKTLGQTPIPEELPAKQIAPPTADELAAYKAARGIK